MAIDWTDSTKRKAFREALQAVYPRDADLERFVDEELNENLVVIAGGDNLEDLAYNLIQWARRKDRLCDVYSAFKQQNPRNNVIKIVERQSLISKASNLVPEDWEMLFGCFLEDDLKYVEKAFKQGFREVLGIDFCSVRPNDPLLLEALQIRELLEEYDVNSQGPILAVRFVEHVIDQLSSESLSRNLSTMQQWRDRIAASFQVLPVVPTSDQTAIRRGAYLLVTLEESGSDVNVYPELHITGAENPISFGASQKNGSIDQVADWMSEWIRQAEELLETDICDVEQVTLEVFLPCRYLEEDIADCWSIKNKRGESIAFGIHRRFVVRSSDRVRDRQIQKALHDRWIELNESVQEKNVCEKFHLQTDCPKGKGVLCALLNDNGAIGLKFLAQLPTDPSDRIDLFNGIIDAAIPIALWSSETADVDVISLKAEFDTLLKECQITNFTDLARQWRMQRMKFPAAKYIKLLCDRPDRLPRLPDVKNQPDTDAYVAS